LANKGHSDAGGNSIVELSGRKGIPHLSVKEWERLEALEKPDRDSLILRLLYETGCTVNELVNIKGAHCDLAANIIRIRPEHSRNHEARTAYISDSLARLLKEHCSQNTGEYVLSSRQSQSMTTKRVRQIVHSYCSKIGLRKAGPQILRYTHIVHAYLKDIPLEAIQKQVGLRRSRAIDIFQCLPEKESKDAYRRFIE
jgi:integrase